MLTIHSQKSNQLLAVPVLGIHVKIFCLSHNVKIYWSLLKKIKSERKSGWGGGGVKIYSLFMIEFQGWTSKNSHNSHCVSGSQFFLDENKFSQDIWCVAETCSKALEECRNSIKFRGIYSTSVISFRMDSLHVKKGWSASLRIRSYTKWLLWSNFEALCG